MNTVNRYTRAGKNGKDIQCPYCNHVKRVYHFSWGASTCGPSNHSLGGCGVMVEKNDWLVVE
jgi:hypothetical protein